MNDYFHNDYINFTKIDPHLFALISIVNKHGSAEGGWIAEVEIRLAKPARKAGAGAWLSLAKFVAKKKSK